ncbi:hypothetical protein V2W45_1241835, partial [Cenococcum geophilum]
TRKHFKPTMCNIFFAYPTCGCPCMPCRPYQQPCQVALARRPVRICPPGQRKARVGATGQMCGMCRQIQMEELKAERWIRRRWGNKW